MKTLGLFDEGRPRCANNTGAFSAAGKAARPKRMHFLEFSVSGQISRENPS